MDETPWSVASSSPTTSGPICKYFASGGCSKGDQCPYTHDLTVNASSDADASRGFVLMGQVVNLRANGGASQNNNAMNGYMMRGRQQHVMNPSAVPFAPTVEGWGLGNAGRYGVVETMEEAHWQRGTMDDAALHHHHHHHGHHGGYGQQRYPRNDPHTFSPNSMLSSSNGLVLGNGFPASSGGETDGTTHYSAGPFQWGQQQQQQQVHVDAAPYHHQQQQQGGGSVVYGAWQQPNEELMQRRRMQAMRTPLKSNVKPGMKGGEDDVSPSRRRHRHRGNGGGSGGSGSRPTVPSPNKQQAAADSSARTAETHRRLRNRPE